MEAFPKSLLLQWLELNFDEDLEKQEFTLTKELIRADRVCVWDDYVSLFKKITVIDSGDVLSLATESDGGLKLFARLLRKGTKNRNEYDVESLVTDTMKSQDIAHYLLVKKVHSKSFKYSGFIENIVRTCIYYEYGSFDILCYLAYKYPEEVSNTLEEILEDTEIYYRTYLDELNEILVQRSSDKQFQFLASNLRTTSKMYKMPSNRLARALVTDSRLTSKHRAVFTELTNLDTTHLGKLLKYLKNTQTDISTYLSYIALQDTSTEVLSYLLTAKSMPTPYTRNVDLILFYIYTFNLGFPENLNQTGSDEYTEQEADIGYSQVF